MIGKTRDLYKKRKKKKEEKVHITNLSVSFTLKFNFHSSINDPKSSRNINIEISHLILINWEKNNTILRDRIVIHFLLEKSQK